MCIVSNWVNEAQDLMAVTKYDDLPNSLIPTQYWSIWQENGSEERRWGRQKCKTQNNEIFKESKKIKIEEWRP